MACAGSKQTFQSRARNALVIRVKIQRDWQCVFPLFFTPTPLLTDTHKSESQREEPCSDRASCQRDKYGYCPDPGKEKGTPVTPGYERSTARLPSVCSTETP